jgi:hypothetical protein
VIASSTCRRKPLALSKEASIVRWDSVVVVFFTQLKNGEKNECYYYLSSFLTSLGIKTASPHKSINLYFVLGGVNKIKSRFMILNL